MSVAMLGEFFSTIDSLREERAAEVRTAHQLTRRLSSCLFAKVVEHTKKLRPSVHRDTSTGVAELEFVMAMILELEMVTVDQLQPFIKHFRALDVDLSGRV